MLRPEQVDFFQEHGYVVVENVLNDKQLKTSHSIIDEWIEHSRSLCEDDGVFVLESTHTAQTPTLRRITEPAKHHAFFYDLVRLDTLLDIVEPLVGPNFRYHHSKLNFKDSGGGAAIEWHQDFAFFPSTNDDIVGCGIALDDNDRDNGPLLVIPGSHHGPIFDHHQNGTFVGAVPADRPEIDLSKAVPVVMKAGDMSIHHCRTLHASAVNSSPKSRRLLFYEYSAADAWPLDNAPTLDEYQDTMLRGTFNGTFRTIPITCRLPFRDDPKTPIFNLQEPLKKRAFAGR